MIADHFDGAGAGSSPAVTGQMLDAGGIAEWLVEHLHAP